MDLIASFNSQRINTFHFFVIHGLMANKDLVFLFDTGASCPVLGVNSFFREGESTNSRAILERLLRDELSAQNILPRPIPLKAANKQEMTTYPCVCHHVSIENTAELDFYFDISFDDISIPLLGNSFIDDCAYNHSINGNLSITGIKPQAGAVFYGGHKALDFDKVTALFANTGNC